MVRKIHFSWRYNRRFKTRNKQRSKLWYILAAVLLVVGIRYFFRQRVEVAVKMDTSLEQETTGVINLGREIYLRIVSTVIPGFNSSQQEGEAATKPGQNTEKNALTNPKAIIVAQIPYLGITTEPLINKPENTAAPPKITIPANHELNKGKKIIIYHTHATESFVPSSGKAFISTDPSQTVAQMGLELADILQNEHQIPVVHEQTIHDVPRTGAYERALPTIKKLLQSYPDAALVVDLHRDGVAKEVTTAELNGKPSARILLVVGSRHANWEENMQKAKFLHQELEKLAPGISRGIRERPLVYNQNLHTGSLLIELGGYQNSLEEARRTLPVLAQALAKLYHAAS
ncbi:MAG: stage II sporulation protein P [Firmicutes bacterium]|nr:stage II sporulation protein P [Bacillota bacterium]